VTNLSILGVPANIKSRTCRKEIRNVTTAANLLCSNTTMAHNTKYRHTEEYYYRALLERPTGKQRNDEHNALYHPSFLLNVGRRGMTASTKIPNAVFELLRCSFPPLLPISPSAIILTFFNMLYAPAKHRQIININLVDFHGLFHKDLRKLHKNQPNYLVPIFFM